jgi:hypothetical protein
MPRSFRHRSDNFFPATLMRAVNLQSVPLRFWATPSMLLPLSVLARIRQWARTRCATSSARSFISRTASARKNRLEKFSSALAVLASASRFRLRTNDPHGWRRRGVAYDTWVRCSPPIDGYLH